MKASEINKAIAEICGWRLNWTIGGVRLNRWVDNNGVIRGELPPDYCGDLNAMADADKYAGEHVMSCDQWSRYGIELQKIHPTAIAIDKGTMNPGDFYDLATLVTGLTAAQRAEAFLRTLGKWVEEEKAKPNPIEPADPNCSGVPR